MAIFLPMQHLDGTTVIKREIFRLRKAGAAPIIVLCGYQQEVLKNHLSHNGVIFCEDAQFAAHDFYGTLAVGLQFAQNLCDRVLVVPVEYPVFSGDTVRALMDCEDSTVPVFQGKQGFPWLHVFSEDLPAQNGKKELSVEDQGISYSLTEKDGPERIEEYTRWQRDANALQMKLKVVFTKEEDFFGPGVYQVLRNIDETGSIQAAAGRMHMSYSKCWKMINKVEEQMGFKFVDRVNGGKHGGSSTLTQEARVFLDRYRALCEDIGKMSRNFFDVYFREFQ